jgi:hypothetical protein
MLAAVRALRDELVAPQTVHAPVAARELRRAKPGLITARARGAPQRPLARPGALARHVHAINDGGSSGR